MKTQKFGLEVELTGITRAQAADIVLGYFGSTARLEHVGGHYDEYRVTASDGRVWKFVSDGSILPRRKERGRGLVPASAEYSVEMVSPILTYEDIERVQELVRRLRSKGGISSSQQRCGIHVHVGAGQHTPTSLKNLVNLVASKEGKCQNSGHGVMTHGISPHFSPKKATKCSHFPHSLLKWEVLSPL